MPMTIGNALLLFDSLALLDVRDFVSIDLIQLDSITTFLALPVQARVCTIHGSSYSSIIVGSQPEN